MLAKMHRSDRKASRAEIAEAMASCLKTGTAVVGDYCE